MDRNYEQEYKKAFEAAKGLHDAGNALTKQQMEIVFPQLAESEDERIRKALIDGVSQIRCKGDITREQMLAYLEKQKEQKKSLSERFRPDFPAVADFIESVDELEKNNAMKEQKPAEWSEDIIRKAVKEVGLTQHQIDWFKNNVFPPKPEWSEEDRLHYANVLEALEYVKGCKSDYDKIEAVKSDISWLKLLRNRVGKDSLQPHWKPSEEQMKALLRVVDKARELHYSLNSGYDEYDVLRSLYEQLKKL